jgi:hypothetical protein
MHGLQAISMLFWPSSHTMCPMMGNLVRTFFDLSRHIFTPCRGAPYRFSWTYRGAFGRKYGGGSLANTEIIWPRRKSMFCIIHLCILLTRSQIIAIVMDNASNNNTLMTSLESRCQQRGISFSAQDARMQCMPHTIHLAAIKVSQFMFLDCYSLYLIARLPCLASGRDRSDIKDWGQESRCTKWQLSRQCYPTSLAWSWWQCNNKCRSWCDWWGSGRGRWCWPSRACAPCGWKGKKCCCLSIYNSN